MPDLTPIENYWELVKYVMYQGGKKHGSQSFTSQVVLAAAANIGCDKNIKLDWFNG